MQTQAGFLISQIKQIGGRVFEKILAHEKVDAFNGAQGKILYVLWQKEGISIVELSKAVGLAKTTLTSMLDRMEESGLIQRQPAPEDKRKSLLFLTDRARGLQSKYDEVSEKMNEIYFEGFTKQDIERFEGYLQRVLTNIQKEDSL